MLDRRKFIRTGSVLLPAIFGGASLRAFAGASILDAPFLNALAGGEDNGRVLVLIQLNGGNDGLNTVIPLDLYDTYNAARNNIAIPEDKVLRLVGTDATALHPSLGEVQSLFNRGQVNIIQSVSYPQPNFSHFRATDIWMTGADSSQVLQTGWAGRYLDSRYPRFPQDYPNPGMPDPLAVQVGSIVSPALQGPALTMGMAISNPDNFYSLVDGQPPSSSGGRAGDLLTYVREMTVKTDQYAGVIKAAAQKVKVQSSCYPAPGKNALADQLKIVARLIAGGLRTKVYMVNLGSFDTHARQLDAHTKLLGKLSEAIGAFMDDLEHLKVSDRVVAMTFSEFGRRIKSNASGGTDHGAAAPVFLFGSMVQGGILGNSPALPAAASVNDNVPMQYDFRSLYATLLEKWFGVEPAEAEKLLLKNYQSLPVLPDFGNAAPVSVGMDDADVTAWRSLPSDFSTSAKLSFHAAGGHALVQVFDREGKLVAVPFNASVSPGDYSATFDPGPLPDGVYYARLESGSFQQVRVLERKSC